MKFCLYMGTVSPHQLPLAKELVKRLGAAEFRYVYKRKLEADRQALGWSTDEFDWMIPSDSCEAREWLLNADILMSGERDVSLFKARSMIGKKTIYSSERWFKPILILGRHWCAFDGRFRLLFPRYRKMVRDLVGLVRCDPNFMLYPMGIHAARDFAWLLGGEITDFEPKPGGRVFGRGKWLEKIRIWGYFVAPSTSSVPRQGTPYQISKPLKERTVLWVGRFFDWKRVDVLIQAVKKTGCKLDIFGKGPEEPRLRRLIGNCQRIRLSGSISLQEVRHEMREHDFYVLCSDGGEGWGATLNEAIEEGLCVFGTYEAGASATVLPRSRLFHAGNVKALVALLSRPIRSDVRWLWSAQHAAETMKDLCSL